MNHTEKVRETWRHQELGTGSVDFRKLVRYATLAASSHNTQPWRFRLESDRIRILPDFSRRCPAVDPDDHHLYASLGCASENLLQAARAAGLEGQYSYEEETSGVLVEFEPCEPHRSDLFEAIPWRQCSRAEYDGVPISDEELKQLEAAGRGAGVSTLLMTDDAQTELVARYVEKGNNAQFDDPEWARELKAWIRFNGAEAVRLGDGLYGPSMGSPAVPRWLGRLAMRFGFSAKTQNAKDLRHIRSSSAIAVVYSDVDDKTHWIEAGRCYQRLALKAAALGLRTAFVNQPVEVTELRPEFARAIGIDGRRPDLVVRIGRGPEMPRSLRRPVEEVVE